MAAACLAPITKERPILNCIVRHVDPSPIHEHLPVACDEPIRRRAAVSIIAATLPERASQMRVDIMGLGWQGQADGENGRKQGRFGKHVMLPTLGGLDAVSGAQRPRDGIPADLILCF